MPYIAERNNEDALDQNARRTARRAGWLVRKSRSKNAAENRGGFMIIDPRTGFPVAGFCYELSAESVMEYCTN